MIPVLERQAASPLTTVRPMLPVALALLRALRPFQWVKNLTVALPLLLAGGAGGTWSGRALAQVTVVCGLFTLGAAATYLVNDLTDRRRDRLHPTKRARPIASGALRPGLAAAVAVLLYAALALAIGAHPAPMTLPVIVYVGMNLLYSRFLKHIALLDVFILGAGFVLRVVAGALAAGTPVSIWLVLCVLSGSLVLALGKRRHEMALTAAAPRRQEQRPALRGYSAQLIDNLLPIAGAVCMVAYVSMLGAEVVHRPFGVPMVLISTLLAMFGLARYIQVLLAGGGADPVRTMLRDPVMLAVGVLWTGTFLAVPVVGAMLV